MSNYSSLWFFDKGGENLNFDYSKGYWEGTMYLPKVSVGLFEVQQLFIVQEFIDATTNGIEYGYPHAQSDVTLDGWTVEWETTTPEEIYLFEFNTQIDESFIEKKESAFIALDYYVTDTIDTSGIVTSSNIESASVQLNITLSSKDADVYQRTLVIKEGSNIIAKITFYGETEEEDERLKTLMNNFGYTVDNDLSTIFYETDVKENLPDFSVINRKRKEMMLAGPETYPFTGSYKGLVNIINFFGFPDLFIKEYWKNVDISSDNYGKYVFSDAITIGKGSTLNNVKIQIPQSTLRKTSLFGLFYKINDVVEGSFDEYDFPVTEENFTYSIEEVLIKLFALKRKLQKDYLPLNARIIDIVGEAEYFGKAEIENTISFSETGTYKVGITPTCNVSPSSTVYMSDLREIEDLTFANFTPYNIQKNIWTGAGEPSSWVPSPSVGEENNPAGEPVSGSTYSLAEVSDVLLGYFTRFAPNFQGQAQGTINSGDGQNAPIFPDKPGIPVGAPIVLENTSFSDIDWSQIDSSWSELGTGENYIFDFEPNDNSYLAGDILTITDLVSGESISYSATSLDDNESVCEGLKTAWETKITAGDQPWSNFYLEVVTTSTGYALRANGIGLAAIGYQFNFQTSVESLTPSPPTFVKKILPIGNLYTWETIGRGSFYEIEWRVYKEETDTPEYLHIKRGPIQDYNRYPLILPYVGDYEVQLTIFDTFNNASISTNACNIAVEGKNVEMNGYYRNFKPDVNWSDLSSYDYDTIGSIWNIPDEPQVTWNESTISYESLNYASGPMLNTFSTQDPNFHIQNYQNTGAISFPGPYRWDNLDTGSWEDFETQWWDSLAVSGDTPAFFKITSVVPLTSIYFNDGDTNTSVLVPTTVTTLAELGKFLNASTNQIASRFEYNVVYDSSAVAQYIMAVAKYTGPYGDLVSVSGDPSGTVVTGYEKGIVNNVTWSTMKVIDDWKILPRYSFITMTYDKCRIAGKDKATWKISNVSKPGSDDIYFSSKYLTYLFKEPGKYKIGLELYDSNLNKYEIEKNMLIIK